MINVADLDEILSACFNIPCCSRIWQCYQNTYRL